MRENLLIEAAMWRDAAMRAANGVKLYDLTTASEMCLRHSGHSDMTTTMPFDNLSRSLACLWLALECEDEANALRPERGGGRMTARSKYWCDTCESVVYADDVHSCYDAKAVRGQQERERKMAALERAVVEAAEAWEFAFRDPADPMGYEVDDKHDALLTAVRRYREGRDDRP